MGVRLRTGRSFTAADTTTSERLVVVNDAFVARFFPNEDPVGRTLNTGFDERGERIIGVVNDVAEGDLTDGPAPARAADVEGTPGPRLSGTRAPARPVSGGRRPGRHPRQRHRPRS